jgi:ribonucleoside-diphosphate reductase alpha chain/ribonucleoside-triphosphate reductase
MNQLGSFVYYRNYSRWVPEEMRREYWWETVLVPWNINCSLVPTSTEEAEKLYKNILTEAVPLGKDLLGGQHRRTKYYPMSNYNCSFQ